MKAYLYRKPGAPWELEEVPDPRPGAGEVLVEVKAAGVCGTDLHYRHGRLEPYTAPLIPGHEIAGVVADVGEGVDGVCTGERVCVHYIVSCGSCRHCDTGHDNRCLRRRSVGAHLPGGFAEYLVVPARNAFRLADSIGFEQGAIMGCAVSTAYHALRLGWLGPGETVVVFGLGGVGLHAVALARLLGAGLVVGVDNDEPKLAIARTFGADLCLHAGRGDLVEVVRELTGGYGADLALECSGHPACMAAAVGCVHGKSIYASGRVVGVAPCRDEVRLTRPWQFREGALLRSGDHTRAELRQVIRLVEQGRVDLSASVTHRFAFEELERAMELVEARREPVVRAVLVRQ